MAIDIIVKKMYFLIQKKEIEKKKRKLVGYVRVSSKKQEDDLISQK